MMARRGFVVRIAALVAATVVLCGLPSWAPAQTAYPSRPVRVVAPFPPGQGTELIARQMAVYLSAALGQSFFVDNKPGAAGIIGTQFVKNAAPDGYTLLVAGGGPLAINAAFYRKLPYDPLKDFQPIAMIAAVPNVLVVRADFPANNLKDVVAYIHKSDGKLNYASSGNGVPNHLIMELLKSAADLHITHVPYGGSGGAITALMAGDVAMMFDTAAAVMPHIKSGRLKVIAVAGGNRALALPDVPTVAEQGYPGFAAQGWSALVAPAGTPPEVIRRLNAETMAILKKPEVRAQLIALGTDPMEFSLDQTVAYMKSEVANWARAVKLAGVSAD
ncbi:MAG: Tripartite tricarboxylate transporter family receptor [Ramlibacter sp.]|nr:Tripartite tricarboxylate transporter family receptor [Ramlibacter sp.]